MSDSNDPNAREPWTADAYERAVATQLAAERPPSPFDRWIAADRGVLPSWPFALRVAAVVLVLLPRDLIVRGVERIRGHRRWRPQSTWDTRLNTPRAYQHAVRRLGLRPGDDVDDTSVHQMLSLMAHEARTGERYWWEHEYEDDYMPPA